MQLLANENINVIQLLCSRFTCIINVYHMPVRAKNMIGMAQIIITYCVGARIMLESKYIGFKKKTTDSHSYTPFGLSALSSTKINFRVLIISMILLRPLPKYTITVNATSEMKAWGYYDLNIFYRFSFKCLMALPLYCLKRWVVSQISYVLFRLSFKYIIALPLHCLK